MSKAKKGIGIIRKLNKALPQHSLITIYKSFVRPHLDYGDIIYDQPNKESLNQKIERIQYNAALAIRRWFRKLCTFYKIKATVVPQNFSDLIPQTNHLYNTCAAENVTIFYSRTNAFKYSFFRYTV